MDTKDEKSQIYIPEAATSVEESDTTPFLR